MKIKTVTANNRKKAFEVLTASETYSFPYALLRVQPDADNRVAEAYPDQELGSEAFTYRLADGQEDTIHLDAVLEYNRDPAYLKDLLLYRLTLEAQKAVESSDLSKRELIRALGTSASQFYRLLDPTNQTKSVGQMLALLHLLGREVDVVVSPSRGQQNSNPLGSDTWTRSEQRMKTLSSVLILVLVACSSYIECSAQERPPVIDMHMHAHHIPLDLPPGAPPPCLPRPCQPEGAATATSDESLQETLEAMQRYNIVLGFLSSADLDIVQDWMSTAPGRFIPSPFIEAPGDLSPEMLRQEYEAGRLAGMGEIGSQLLGVPPNDPALAPYYELAEEFDVPVLIHTAGIGPPVPGFRTGAGNPLLLEDVLVRHPDLRVFVENSGYPFLDDMIAMMYQYPQLYGDLSTITWVIPRPAFHRYVEELVRAGLGKRLLFGSDQMRWPEKIGEALEAIEEADYLTEEQKRDILFNNAARFLRLEAEPR